MAQVLVQSELRAAFLTLVSLMIATHCVAQTTPDELTLVPQYAAAAPLSAEAKADRLALANEIANPVTNLANLPLRFTYQDGIGPKHASTVTMLAQPLIPIALNRELNLVVQTNLPFTYAGSVANGVDSTFGLGDTLQGFYVVPTDPGRRGWIFGAGPAFQYPTATDDRLGTGRWCAGPTGALVRQYQSWTYGVVAHQLWSFAGDDSRKDVNFTLLHPLFTYTFPTATGVTLESDSAYDWIAKQWTVPLQLSISQVVVRGRRPIQLSLSGRYFAVKPDFGPDWGIRLSVIFLFPN